MIHEKTNAQNSQQISFPGFPSPTQTTSVISNRYISNTETTESINITKNTEH